MNEEDLIDLGFTRCDDADGDDKFYYYSYDLNGESGCGSLLTDTSDEVKDGKWKVYAWDINEKLVFTNIDDVEVYIDIIEKNINDV